MPNDVSFIGENERIVTVGTKTNFSWFLIRENWSNLLLKRYQFVVRS